jgi:hypothetical protein
MEMCWPAPTFREFLAHSVSASHSCVEPRHAGENFVLASFSAGTQAPIIDKLSLFHTNGVPPIPYQAII